MSAALTDQELRFLLDPERFDGGGTEDSIPEPSGVPDDVGFDGLDGGELFSESPLALEEPRADAAAVGALSGMLPEISLRKVLETVDGADMEGVVVVTGALEEHHLWIRQGRISDWVPQRVESRRLGRRLVRAGLVTIQQIDAAVLRQEGAPAPLGQLLVEEGVATAEEIDEAAREQALEDIYSLFVWTEGFVEFHEGPPGLTERDALDSMEAFDTAEIMAEVERREPEWRSLIESLGSLDEILVAAGDADTGHLTQSHRDVLAALDGKSSLLELANKTMMAPFDCAHVVFELYQARMIEVAPVREVLDVVHSCLATDDRAKAVGLLRNLVKREVPNPETVHEVAELLVRCKENRKAADFLLKAAHGCDLAADRLELAREAHRCNGRSTKILAYFRDRLLECGAEHDELLAVTCALADGWIRDGWLEEALDILAPFALETSDDTQALTRRVRALTRLDRPQEAILELIELAELCRRDGLNDRLAKIYESILRLDSERQDIAAALRALRPGRRLNKKIVLAIAGALLLIGAAGGFVWYEGHTGEQRLDDWLSRVRGELVSGDTAAAMTIFRETDEFVDREESAVLKGQIDERMAREKEQRSAAFLARISEAADHVKRRELEDAIGLYVELAKDKEFGNRVIKIIDARFGSMVQSLTELAASLPAAIPDAPDSLDTPQAIAAGLESLDRDFVESDRALAQGVFDVTDVKAISGLVGEARFARLRTAAEQVLTVFAQADQRRKLYEAARDRTNVRRGLEGLWIAAQKHEAAFDVAKAHEIYTKLAREYPDGKDGLGKVFESKRDRYGAIARDVEMLEELTRAGELDAATRQLAAMREKEPDVPFDKLVRLPLRVISYPPGAAVSIGGELVGRTPILSSYALDGELKLRMDLEGFESVEHVIDRKIGLLVKVVLVRRPQWTWKAAGVAQRRPAFDGDSLFIVDRSGRLSAVRRGSGDQLWSKATEDLSGLLPTPVIWRDRVILTSLDGPVRCLERRTVRELWRREGVPCEAGGVLIGDLMIVATSPGKLVGLNLAADGEPVFRTRLPGPVATNLIEHDGVIYLTTTNGWLVCADGATGAIRWKQQVGSEVLAPPVIGDGFVACGSMDGRLLAVDPRTGAKRWEQNGLGDLSRAIVYTRGHLVAAIGDRLMAFQGRTGKGGAVYTNPAPWTADPVAVGDVVLVGDRRGVVAVVDAEKLELRYQLRGLAPVAGPVTVMPDGWLAVGFEDRTVSCYAPLQ